jgi:hypothetical protein
MLTMKTQYVDKTFSDKMELLYNGTCGLVNPVHMFVELGSMSVMILNKKTIVSIYTQFRLKIENNRIYNLHIAKRG